MSLSLRPGKVSTLAIAGVALLACSNSASACEPIVPLFRVVGGPGALTRSLTVLLGAVVLKCIAFGLFQKRISILRSALYMFVGNVFTTIIGFVAGAMISSGAAWFIGLPIVWALCFVPAKRVIVAAPNGRFRNTGPGTLAAIMVGALVLSCVLFILAQEASDSQILVLYWIVKLAAIYVALAISIVLTAFWEEWVIWKFSRLPEKDSGWFEPVIKANLLVLVIVTALAAAMMLPQRLKSGNFLVPERSKLERSHAPDAARLAPCQPAANMRHFIR